MTHLFSIEGAVSGTRTRDPQLGKLMLYQLSYYRGAFGKWCLQMSPCDIERTIASALPTECTTLTLVGGPMVGILRNAGAKIQKKIDICKCFGRKNE